MIIKFIDHQLNKITMYRVTLYSLVFLLAIALIFSVFNILPYHPINLIFSVVVLLASCLLVNHIFAYLYHAPSNTESTYITALILALIATPATNTSQILFLITISFFAIASKYIFAINKKHLFNPAAFAVALTGLIFNQYASWWIGTLNMVPFVLIIGFLITRKIKRWDLVLSFLATTGLLILGHAFVRGQNIAFITKALIIDSPLLFFAFIMLTEPITTPPTKNLRIAYGAIVGILYTPFVNIFGFYFSPELALTISNLFAYLVSPKEKLTLKLQEKIKIAANTYDFIFKSDKKINFQPGQYMEWTLGHTKQDTRGMRRYFTLANSPTEDTIRMGVKFYEKPSSYKQALQSLQQGDCIIAAQLAGDFTLPKDTKKKIVFLAGGIGVTPFRSMIKYLTDTHQYRDIILFYANGSFSDIAYQEVFNQAQKDLSIKIIYVLNNLNQTPADFEHEEGPITQALIEEKAPDYQERIFYISGPHNMIEAFEKILKEMGVHKHNIKTDFFPGFA